MFTFYKKLINATFRDAQHRHLLAAIKPFLPAESAALLDIGAGNGEFARMMQQAMPHLSIKGIEVIERGESFIPITLYEGSIFPFEDGAFDYALIINMLHHTRDPMSILKEAMRVSRKAIIIKDHYVNNHLDYFILFLMEHLNPNAGPLREMPLRFYSEKEWNGIFSSVGLICESSTSRFTSYSRFWDIFFGRRMHFIGKYTPLT